MNKTKIDWADCTFNPVTGCLHGCEYCYARRISRRFKGGGYKRDDMISVSKYKKDAFQPPYVLEEPQLTKSKKGCYQDAPYPFGFEPTFHRYRLAEPQRIKKPQNIFVCSMADLFGKWVPDEWIKEVFAACEAAPWHRYLFLTKNPVRYIKLASLRLLPKCDNYWFGSTATTQEMPFWWSNNHHTFVSIEPIHGPFDRVDHPVQKTGWVIIGAESGRRKDKLVPERKWIDNIVANCRETGTSVFMKDSLAGVWGEPLIREYPWETRDDRQEEMR